MPEWLCRPGLSTEWRHMFWLKRTELRETKPTVYSIYSAKKSVFKSPWSSLLKMSLVKNKAKTPATNFLILVINTSKPWTFWSLTDSRSETIVSCYWVALTLAIISPNFVLHRKNKSPLDNAGFFSTITFSWLSNVVYKARKGIGYDDLPALSELDSAYSAATR